MKKGIAVLQHEAKSCWVYAYGTSEASLDGRITVSRHVTVTEEVDYLELFGNGLVRVELCSGGGKQVNLSGVMVDELALSLTDEILEACLTDGKMPQRAEH